MPILRLSGFRMKPPPWRKTSANIVGIALSFFSAAIAPAGEPNTHSATTNTLASFASRVTHGAAGSFDIAMPLTGAPGIENRIVDIYIGVATYAENIDTACECYYELDGARTNAALVDGMVALFEFSTLTSFQVNLVTVFCGGSETVVSFALAYADVDASGLVNRNDKLQVRASIGMPLTNSDFRDDVNADGKIDQRDGIVVRAYKGRSLSP